jgi:N-acetylglucosaminyl-diphospho-decaprenol L-rhamnosyltransferase
MLSAVVVNYRMASFLPALAASLRASGAAEVVVVDNPSTPEERARVAALEGVRPLFPEENRGYGAALNAGARAAGGDALLLMNPDIEVPPGALAPLVDALERFAASGPLFTWDRGGRWLHPHPRPHTWRSDLTFRTRPAAALRQALAFQSRLWTAAGPVEVPLLSGAALAVRRSAFEGVGGFDERYFMYFEENDLFERLRRAGGRAAVVPSSRFVHFHEPGRHEGQDGRYQASQELYERTWFPELYRKGRAKLPAPAPPAHPPLGWDEPVAVKGRTVLYALSPFLIPCAAAFGVEGTPTPRELLAGTPARGGTLALAEGSAVREAWALGVK